jgi:hypothetical protein
MRALVPALAAIAVAATPAQAQRVCLPRDDMLAGLAKRYNEAPMAGAVTYDGNLIELVSTPDGLTWTLIITTPDKRSCIVSNGESWRRRLVPLSDPRI